MYKLVLEDTKLYWLDSWVYVIKNNRKIVNSAIRKIKKIPSKSNRKPTIENKMITKINNGNFFLRSELNKKIHTIEINNAR